MYGICFFYFFAVKTIYDWYILFANIPFSAEFTEVFVADISITFVYELILSTVYSVASLPYSSFVLNMRFPNKILYVGFYSLLIRSEPMWWHVKKQKTKKPLWPLVCKQTIPTDWPPLVGEI
jgi:hypothetical protein